MQYMLMIYDDTYWELSDSGKTSIMAEYDEFVDQIVKSGHFRGTLQLHASTTATTVSEKDGRRITTDGPFAESKEQLGGYFLVECKDLDEAISIAGRIPSVRYGHAVEVRPTTVEMRPPVQAYHEANRR